MMKQNKKRLSTSKILFRVELFLELFSIVLIGYSLILFKNNDKLASVLFMIMGIYTFLMLQRIKYEK